MKATVWRERLKVRAADKLFFHTSDNKFYSLRLKAAKLKTMRQNRTVRCKGAEAVWLNHMICRAFGNYPTLKEFIVTMMVQAVVNVQSKYGEEAAMKELMGMMTEAAQQYCEATKGDEKCEVLN